MNKLPGQETRLIYKDSSRGAAIFDDGSRINVAYEVSLWREFQDGHPFRSWFTSRVWIPGDEYFPHRSIGKKFVLELKDGKRLYLFISKPDGTAEHPPGVVEGFPGLATQN